MAELTPIRREILVDAEAEVAFAVFTDRIGSWWPLARLSVYGAGASVAFRDGAIVETAPGQPDTVWGRVTTWEPPALVAFTWHPGKDAQRASQVTVAFTPSGAQTLVQLEHSGWEVFADPAAARDEYDHGWPTVLDLFQGAVRDDASVPDEVEAAPPESQDEWTWVALTHRPGPAAASVTNVFADPRFGEHVAFLARMQAAGYLVAAGPFGDEPGAGMTILRLPGSDRMADAAQLARTDDTSVATGFFAVTVREWNVVMHT